ncbi:MAG TPA: DUF1501 domain-containing protein [Burkholderiaceae bacterium]|nr:DUF1501 domain-containing protein [Burkholderiaceae bacterium]HPH14768.1 DUF1501 domain-containing protein [Burkholderiaceae bacterium]
MHLIQSPQFHSRRAFLRRSGQLAMTGAGLPVALNLAAMSEAAAFDATDYKALVCVFMFGGNDYSHMVIPYDDPNYNLYNTIRGGGGANQAAGGIALSKASLTATLLNPTVAPVDNVAGTGTRQYAFHPAMTGLAGLFNTGKAAVQLNVGPLVVPLTKAQFSTGNRTTYPVPPQLFSHNDQQSLWQSSSPEGSTVGWGGNMGDLALSGNGNSLFTCMSVSGNAVFLSGDTALQYQLTTNGAIKIRPATDSTVYGSTAVRSTLNSLVRQMTSTNKIENEYNKVTDRALTYESMVTTTLANNVTLPTTFPTGNFGDQLKMVARLIKGRAGLGSVKRQVFFVSLGGFDLHDGLLAQGAVNMDRVSAGMTAFHNEMVAQGMADKVTAFTASDFGRTLASNGDGTDHGWGSHHIVVGGAVKGAAFYGTPPPVSVGSTTAPVDQWQLGQGRLLPTTSVDQYAATMAKWFGVADAEMAGVLPKIGNFGGTAASGVSYPTDLGFML